MVIEKTVFVSRKHYRFGTWGGGVMGNQVHNLLSKHSQEGKLFATYLQFFVFVILSKFLKIFRDTIKGNV